MRNFAGVVLLLAACGHASLPPEGAEDASKRPANSATSKEWQNQNVSRPEELLAGRFPGVQVFRVGGGIAVRIRGGSSIMGDNQPLYVIDGMTIDAGPDGALVGVNPNDIEKIEVLKDISSISLYGSRGANGVILITTKRGK
jgi:TonB-dependent SusC/RagA subfamily outer membrane receptor